MKTDFTKFQKPKYTEEEKVELTMAFVAGKRRAYYYEDERLPKGPKQAYSDHVGGDCRTRQAKAWLKGYAHACDEMNGVLYHYFMYDFLITR